MRTNGESKQSRSLLGEQSWPSSRYAWYVVGVLAFAYLVAIVDRQILSLLIEPIRQDLNISDTQVSLLGWFAFTILYTVMGIPIGWLADHRSRRAIIIVGITVWSFLTALCGLAKTFVQLFLARIGVGIGEAALAPSAFSMLADYFPPHKLGRAIGVYISGGAIGAGLALLVGATVLALVTELPQFTLPIVGSLQPWRIVFIFVALLGILVFILMMTVKEPFRRTPRIKQEVGLYCSNTVSPPSAIAFVTTHWKTYVPIFVGFTMLALVSTAVLTWTPTMYIRTYGWSASSIGYIYGLFLLVLGPLGAIGGGIFADKLRQLGYADAVLRIVIMVAVLSAPTAALLTLASKVSSSLVALALLTVLISATGSLLPTAIQLVTPNRLRAQAAAYSLFIVNLLGAGLGPTVVALITDYVFGYDLALRYSIFIVAVIFMPLGALILWSGLKSFRIDVLAATNES